MTATLGLELALHIDVESVLVHYALRGVAQERGWLLCPDSAGRAGCLVVSDRHRGRAGRLDVLVIKDTPAASQAALDVLWAGSVRSVLLWDEPEALAATIAAIQQGSVVLPERVLDLALLAPRLTDRQQRTVRLMAAGRSNGEIAVALHQSTSTTKRDIGDLLALFDVRNRASLIAAANRFGYLEG